MNDAPYDDGAARLIPFDPDDLFEAIKHGDEEHRRWLKEALHAYRNRQPIPQVRSFPNARDVALREARELLSELLAHAKDAPPKMQKRVAELLAKVEGSGS